MKRLGTVMAGCVLWLAVNGQVPVQQNKFDTTGSNEQYWKKWLDDLYEMGVVMTKDSIKVNEEARKIILDSNFRKVIYPETYTWQVANYLLKGMEFKKGFWYLINLYGTDTANKKLVIQTLVPFDKLMDMEKIMASTFYTYALLDPKICTYKDGKPVITRPDIIEKKFAELKEIISYIEYFRKQQKG